MVKWLYLLVIGLIMMTLVIIVIGSDLGGQSGETETNKQLKSMVEHNLDNAIPEVIEAEYIVVIDPGHGGKDSGAIGYSGAYEKDFTLELSLEIKRLLESEPLIDVYLTREADEFLSSTTRDRPLFANELDADIFISVHGNTFVEEEVSGTETFYHSEDAEAFAETIHEHVVQATGFNDRGVKPETYFVLQDTNMPATLLEIGYLTNQDEEKEMLTEAFQRKVASAIVDGILEYFEDEAEDEKDTNDEDQEQDENESEDEAA